MSEPDIFLMLLTSISRIVHHSASQKLLMDGSRTVAWSVDINPVEGHESYLQIHWIATQLGKYFDFLSYIKTMADLNANTNLYIKCFCPMQLNHNNYLLNLFLRASSGKKLSETLTLT